MDCLIAVEGGLGKNVMLTSILDELKSKYENIYVVSSYVDVFKACPIVKDAFMMGQDIYTDLVLDDNVEVLYKEPYSNNLFIKKQEHIFNAWRSEYGIAVDSVNSNKPATKHQNIDVRTIVPNIREQIMQYVVEWKNDFIIVQFNGGQSPLQLSAQYDWHNEPIKRNYFEAQKLINLYKEKHPNTTIVQFGLKNEPTFENCVKIEIPYLFYTELSRFAKCIICTDSSLQHLATGNNTCVNVIWLETQPQHFGYAENNNICGKVRNAQPYFKPLGSSPAIAHAPSPEDVLASVESFAKSKGVQL